MEKHYILNNPMSIKNTIDGDIGYLTFTDRDGNKIDIIYYGKYEKEFIRDNLGDAFFQLSKDLA